MQVWINILFRSDFTTIDKNIETFFNFYHKNLLDKKDTKLLNELDSYRLLEDKEFQNLLNKLRDKFFSNKYLDLYKLDNLFH